MVVSQRLICTTDELIEGERGVRFEIQRYGKQQAAFVVRFEGRPCAFLNQCGHVPVELDWQEGEFFDDSRLYLVCATHGALYHPASGECVGGRCAGRGLVPISVVEHDGHIYLVETQ